MLDVVSASSTEKALEIIATEQIDLVVLDLSLGQDSGVDLLPDLHDRDGKVIPVIVFSNRVRHFGPDDDHVDGDEQVSFAFSKMYSPLEHLTAAVRDRLSLPATQHQREVA